MVRMSLNNRDLLLVYLVSSVDLFAVGLTVPLFSNHLRQLGASHFAVGLITSLYSGLQVLSGPLIGSWSDVKNRKSVLSTTLLICSISYIILSFLDSVLLIACIRIVLGLFKHTQSLTRAMISDLLPVEKRAGAFGRVAAFSSVGFVLGPILGGHLSEIENGFKYVAFFTGLLFIINVGFTACLNEIRSHSHHSEPQGFLSSYRTLLEVEWNKLWHVFLLRFLLGLSVTTFFSQQSIYLKEHFHLAPRQIGYTISYFSFIGTLSSFSLHYIKKYLYGNDDNCLRRIRHFFLLLSLSILGLSLAPKIELYWIVLLPFAVSSAVLRIASMELTLKEAGSHKGSLSGASNSVMSIARFLAPATTGFAADFIGKDSGMIVGIFPAALACFMTVILGKKFKRKTQ